MATLHAYVKRLYVYSRKICFFLNWSGCLVCKKVVNFQQYNICVSIITVVLVSFNVWVA